MLRACERRRRIHPRLALAFQAAALALALRVPAAAAATVPTWWRAARLTARADSLFSINRPQVGWAYLDSLLAAARAQGDRRFELGTRIAHGRALAFAGRFAPSRAELDSALAIATARGDTLWMERAMASLALGFLFEGRLRESTPIYRRALPLAQHVRDREYQAYVWMGLAYDALLSGRPREARDGYRRGLALGEGLLNVLASRTARIGLARALAAMRDYDGSRAAYLRLLEEARREGDRVHESQALNNLGACEFTVGDPAAAVEYWRQAVAIQRTFADATVVSTPIANIAMALTELGRLDEAATLIEKNARDLDSLGARAGWASALNQLGTVRRLQGRLDEAESCFRKTSAMGDSLTLDEARVAATGLASALEGQGRFEPALDLLGRFEKQHAGKSDEVPNDSFERVFVDCLLALDRPREALPRASKAERVGEAVGIATGWAPLREARAWRALGRSDSAIVALRRAAREWEVWRGGSRDLGWREARGGEAAAIYTQLADLLLETPNGAPTRNQAREAFEALQPFKARTLEERMRGPDAFSSRGPDTRVSVDSLQRSVLRDGELFLDFFVGEQKSFLFAITRRQIRAVGLPGADELGPKSARFRDLLMTAPSPSGAATMTALCDSAGLALGTRIFGPLADLVRQSRRVLISADAALSILPLGATLLAPATGGKPEALLAGREVLVVPSATMLAELRARAARPSAAPRKLLVLARTTDAGGRPLAGVDREARWLGGAFEGVEMRARHGEPSLAAVAADFAHYEVLHVAAHTSLDPVLPWRSGILIGADASRMDAPDPYLRAATIAGLHLTARLCVLSGCSSAGTRSLFGEGLQGLSSAFVSAGVPTVIATLWPVDDEATASLVESFYRALARGAPAAAALREAQLELRSQAATQHPFYWAGFVLVGEPSTRITLRRKTGALPLREHF